MKLIELSTTEDHTLFEYGDCRITFSKKRPLHACIISFINGFPSAPCEKEITAIIKIFFTIDGKDIPYLKTKMFTDTALHIWEKTPFTKHIIFGK